MPISLVRYINKQKGLELIELEFPIDVTNIDGGSGPKKLTENKIKTKMRRSLTREDFMTCCTFKRTAKGKYEIFKIHEDHTHPLTTPSKIPMLKSAKNMNPMLKNVLRASH